MTDETQVEAPAIADDKDTQDDQIAKADAKADDQDESGEAPEADEHGTKQKDPAVSGVQKRFDELTREKHDERRRREALERDVEYLRRENERYRSSVQQPVKQEAEQAEKTLADFAYDDAAYAKYLRQNSVEIARKEAREAIKAEVEREQAEKRQQQFLKRVQAFEKSNPDFRFDDIRNADLAITKDMVDVITESESAPQLLQHLYKNPDVADQLSRLPVHLVAREIGRMEARLEYEAKQAKTANVSKAPPPPPKVEGVNPGSPVKTTDASGDELPIEKWVALERKRLAQKQSR